MDLSWIDGKKTYAVAICVVLVAAVQQFGGLPDPVQDGMQNLLVALIGVGAATLRAAISKSVPAPLVPLIDPAIEKAADQIKADLIKFLEEQKKSPATLLSPQPILPPGGASSVS